MTIIAITGDAGSGKTTASQALVGLGYKKLSFAQPVKDIAKMFGWDGEKDDKGRRLLQLIGTECGRGYNDRIWLDKMEERIADIEVSDILTENSTNIVIDDARFDNEAELVKSFHGIIIRLKGKSYYRKSFWQKLKSFLGLNKLASHASERGISDKYIDFEMTFPNYNNAEVFKEVFLKRIKEVIAI